MQGAKDEDVQAGERFLKKTDKKKEKNVEWLQIATCTKCRCESRLERGEMRVDRVSQKGTQCSGWRVMKVRAAKK